MSNLTALPTTVGSIVTYDTWEDNEQTEKFRAVITLVGGGWNGKEIVAAEWMDSYGQDGRIDPVTEEDILAGNPEIVFEAPEAVDGGPVEDIYEFNLGSVVYEVEEEENMWGGLVGMDYGEVLSYTFTPGFIDPQDGELTDCYWISSYGASLGTDSMSELELRSLVARK